jgi:hypothetical protein
VSIQYSASDPDFGDAVEVELYASSADSGQGGIRFARGLPGGVNLVASLDPGAVPPGTYRVLAHATDTRGGDAWAEAGGKVTVGEAQNTGAFLEILQPDGVDDVDERGVVAITWEVSVPLGATGTLSLFVDEDDEGEGGTPLAAGIAIGPEDLRAFAWDTNGLEPGEYFVYGVVETDEARVVSHAPGAVVVAGQGCACNGASHVRSGGPGSRRVAGLLAAGVLAILALCSRRGGPRRDTCATGSSPTSTATSKRSPSA